MTGTPGGFPAVLLCGGRGTRLGGDREKPLVEVGGRPMVARVLDALAEADGVDRVLAVTSPSAPATRRALRGNLGDDADIECTVRDGDGDGYVPDLGVGLDAVNGPAVSVAADVPLLAGEDVDDAVDAATGTVDGGVSGTSGGVSGTGGGVSGPTDAVPSVSVCVPAATKRRLGVSVDTSFDHGGRSVAPTGLNVVGDGPDRVVVRDRTALAVNVNRPADLDVAQRLAGE